MSESVRTATFDEYLVLEQHGDQRHEFVGGRIYSMAGGTERHELVKDAIYSRWRAGALAAGCRPFTGRMLRTPSGNVEVATWDGGQVHWVALGSGQVLMSPYGDIELDELYDEVDTVAT